jgi:hypothetical protein
MGSRLELHEELKAILGTKNVYFQPPASFKMNYPCIRYSKAPPDLKRANNNIYQNTSRYEITVIDDDPDSDIPDKILAHFRMCSLDRSYTAENLNHTTLTLYY